MRLPVLIFDFGNVIGFFDYTRIFERIAPLMGIEVDELRLRLKAEGFAELLSEFECGRIAPEAFAATLLERLKIQMPYERFVAAWQDIFSLNEPLAALIAALKESGYTLLLGSNTNVLQFDHYRRQFAATMVHFDKLIASHEVGSMKPARPFYEACVTAAGIPADQCLFIDDIEDNVEGARRAGLRAIRFVDTEQLRAELANLGVAVATA